ncbi:phage terminase large subunit [Streptomyces sp. HP-A2021]|uniref:phage terminase large subunit n=1 Tax=Streptomyces sp. HP-A2021 TaxID=2927875 RepID=UPI001FAFEFDC|nr:phage terminase large subunit [Streptomyces sp. HP-A2021]UOB09076.1 phage terminase large subunit [Streptomyces sp. HP-A2021]
MTATVVRYEPRGGAKTLLSARDQEICIAGPAGTGKSLAMLQKAFYTSLMVPNCRSLIVRQTHASLTGSTLVTFEQQVATAALAEGVVKWFGGSPRKPAAYQFANGAEILVGGLDRPEKFLSTEFSRIYIDEATQISLKALETLITRLRGNADTYRQIILACNPDHPKHWIKQRCDDGTMRMLHSLHRDNPLYVNADGTLTERGVDYMAKLDALTGVRRLRFRDGIWAAAEGLVYEGWSDAVHVIDPFDIPENWVRWVTVDFGFTNPFVAQLWAEDPDGRLYLVREWVRTRMLVEDHATVIRDRLLAGHPRPRAIITDHDAEDRATLERKLGMGTQSAHKTVSDGIQAFGARLKAQGDGRARLYVFRDALLERDPEMDAAALPIGLAEEALGYVWAVKPGNQTGLKEEPVKENDHSMDAGRYMVAARDLGGRPRVRWL